MFSFFERLTQAFPNKPLHAPPKNLVGFIHYYTSGMWPVLMVVSILSAIVAVLEVSLFGFMGQLVDWFSVAERDTFWATYGRELIWMGLLVLILLPSVVILESLITHQSVMGNYPMRIRCSQIQIYEISISEYPMRASS